MNSSDSLKNYPAHAALKSMPENSGQAVVFAPSLDIQTLISEHEGALNEISRLRGALERIKALVPNDSGKGFHYVMPLRADCGYIAQQALSANQGEV